MDKTKILDHGFVALENHIGSDISVVNSARVSFGKKVESVSIADELLIAYLIKNRHGTPFEHNSFTFHVKAPIFVFREWQRHRIGSFNEMSARYMELAGEWYVPEEGNVRSRVGKPGHYNYEPAMPGVAQQFIMKLLSDCESSYMHYKWALNSGIAPEQARMFLHVNHYSEMYWTVNARSLMNFLNLRNAETAQWEIREYAMAVEMFFAKAMPATHLAFADNNRVAP